MPQKTALILGSTGLTGSHLQTLLLDSSAYRCVRVLVRQKPEFSHPKLEPIVTDMLKLDSVKAAFSVDDVFCCLGTTRKKTPDRVEYQRIDRDLPKEAARLAKEQGADTFLVISAMGASVHSPVFYNRTKGQMEQSVMALGPLCTYIVRPSLILGDRQEARTFEGIGGIVMNALSPLMRGPLTAYRPIRADCIAKAMLALASQRPKEPIWLSDRLQSLAENFLVDGA